MKTQFLLFAAILLICVGTSYAQAPHPENEPFAKQSNTSNSVDACSATATSNSPVCSGNDNNLILSATGGGTYSWRGPNNFSSSNQTPVYGGVSSTQSGIYSVTITNGSCTASATTSVRIDTTPTLNSRLDSPYPLCNGSTLTLASTFYSGDAMVKAYQWSGVGGFSSTEQNPIVGTFGSALTGGYTLTVVNQNNVSCTATSSINIIESVPSSIVFLNNPALACVGGAVLLGSNIVPSTNTQLYQWSGPNGFSSTLAEAIVSGISQGKAGTYTFSVKNASNPTCVLSNTMSVGVINPTVNGTVKPACTYINSTRPETYVISRIQFNTLDFSSGKEVNNYADRTCIGTSVIAGQTYSLTLTHSSGIPSCSVYIDFDNSGAFELPELLYSGFNFFTSTDSRVINITIPNTAVKNTPVRMRFTAGSNNSPCLGQGETEDYALIIRDCPPSVVISGARLYCIGQTVSLTASGGVTYSWTGPGGFTTTSSSMSIANASGSQSGIYTVTVRNEFCSASASINVVVFKPDAAFTTSSGKNYLCPGKTLTLIAPAQEGVQYEWLYNNFPMSPAANSSSFVIAQAGPYTLKVSTNLCKLTATKQLYINSASPVSYTASNTFKPSRLTLTANPPGGQYAWSGPAAFSSSLRSPVILNPNNTNLGVYTITMLTPSTGCTGTATTQVLNSGASRLATDESGDVEMEVSAFPNPTSKILSVSVILPISEGLKLELTNSQGQRMQAWEETQSKTEHRMELDIEKYKDGLYLLQVQSPSRQKTVKVWRKE